MSRAARLNVPHGRYFVIDEFRASEVLVGAPGRLHTEAQLRELAAHRAQYEALLSYTVARWCARVHTHCWLPRCALLEVQIGWAPLERVMHSVRAPFSRYFRATTGSSDPLYAGRYKAWLLEPGCVLDLRRDICWRPVRAGLCRHPTEYPHMTNYCAVNGAVPPFLAKSDVLAWLQQRQHHPRGQLLELLSTAPSPEFASIASGSPHDRRIIGHTVFVRKVHREQRPSPPAVDLDTVTAWSQRTLANRVSALPCTPGSTQNLSQALAAWLASCTGGASVSAVASRLPHLDRSRLERAIARYLQVIPDLFSERTLRRFVDDTWSRRTTPHTGAPTSPASTQGL